MTSRTVIVVGGGPVGLAAAAAAADLGLKVDLFESRPDPRVAPKTSRRSIGLTLNARGLRTLEEMGASNAIRSESVPLPKRIVHLPGGGIDTQCYGDGTLDESLLAIERPRIVSILSEEVARRPNINLHFGTRVTAVDLAGTGVTTNAGHFEADLLIGADGANSMVRTAMETERRFSRSVAWADSCYAEVRLPAVAARGLDQRALHIWPCPPMMAVGFPNLDGTFTVSFFGPPVAFGATWEATEADLEPIVRGSFPDIAARVDRAGAKLSPAPMGSMVSVRCTRWHRDPGTLLIGDAAHAVVPFLGAGMNAGLEDVSHLRMLIREPPGDRSIGAALTEARANDLHALADLAEDHQQTLTHEVDSMGYRLRRKGRALIKRFLPQRGAGLYHRLAFSHEPYRSILNRRSLRYGL